MLTKIQDMTMPELRWQYRRQLDIHKYRKQRGEDTTDALRRLDELANRIVELGGAVPGPRTAPRGFWSESLGRHVSVPED